MSRASPSIVALVVAVSLASRDTSPPADLVIASTSLRSTLVNSRQSGTVFQMDGGEGEGGGDHSPSSH